MLCNVADVPELCNFILPAVHREGPIAVAVSTGGASPALAKRLRSQIAELVGPEHAELAEELAVAAARGEGALRDLRGAARLLRGARHREALVTVSLVGAGPGDPGLITVRGLELIRSCDALVYDVLVAPELVEEAPADALVIPREEHPPGRAERAARLARPRRPRGRPAEGRRPVHLRPRRRGGRGARRRRHPVRGRPRRLGALGRSRLGGDPGHPSRRLGAGHARLRPLGRRRGRSTTPSSPRRPARSSSSWASRISRRSPTG